MMFGEYTAHEAAEWFPMLDDDALAELSEDIARRGQDDPCVTWRGVLVDGRNRWRACEMAGVVPATEERDFEDDQAVVEFVIAGNLKRRHMTQGQKAGVALHYREWAEGRAKERQGERTDLDNDFRADLPRGIDEVRARDEVARLVGVSPRTVQSAFTVEDRGTDELVQAMRQDEVSVDAASHIAKMPHEAQRAVLAAPEGIRREAVAALRETPSMAAEIAADVIDTVEMKRPHLTINTGNDEWYTPREYVDRARAVLGGIDLDPASNDLAQKWVRATTYYTKDRSGLDEVWTGRVWMNPPYSRGLMMRFCAKLCGHVEAGDITHAVVLTHNASDTEWWQTLARTSSAMCHTDGRVKFVNPVEEKASPTQGQTFFYMGDDVAGFVEHFASVGIVTVPYVK
jgi:ParB family chromosome partitioning protein